MNSVEQANALIDRAKNLQEFEIVRTMPNNFMFTGQVPFDMSIYGDQMYIKVLSVNFDEATKTVDTWLQGEAE